MASIMLDVKYGVYFYKLESFWYFLSVKLPSIFKDVVLCEFLMLKYISISPFVVACCLI